VKIWGDFAQQVKIWGYFAPHVKKNWGAVVASAGAVVAAAEDASRRGASLSEGLHIASDSGSARRLAALRAA